MPGSANVCAAADDLHDFMRGQSYWFINHEDPGNRVYLVVIQFHFSPFAALRRNLMNIGILILQGGPDD
jgi:hypothetical protein